eukprot:4801302-Amphidinium_carterae.1
MSCSLPGFGSDVTPKPRIKTRSKRTSNTQQNQGIGTASNPPSSHVGRATATEHCRQQINEDTEQGC